MSVTAGMVCKFSFPTLQTYYIDPDPIPIKGYTILIYYPDNQILQIELSDFVTFNSNCKITIACEIIAEQKGVLENFKMSLCKANIDIVKMGSIYEDIEDAYTEESGTRSNDDTPVDLTQKKEVVYYAKIPDLLPQNAEPGDVLIGTVNTSISLASLKVIYIVPKLPEESQRTDTRSEQNGDDDAKKDINELMLDLQLSYIDNLSLDSEGYKLLNNKLECEYGDNIKFLGYRLESLIKLHKGSLEKLVLDPILPRDIADNIISLADKLINLVKEDKEKEAALVRAVKFKAAAQMASDQPFDETMTMLSGLNCQKDLVWTFLHVQLEIIVGCHYTALHQLQNYVYDPPRTLNDADIEKKCRQKEIELLRIFGETIADKRTALMIARDSHNICPTAQP